MDSEMININPCFACREHEAPAMNRAAAPLLQRQTQG